MMICPTWMGLNLDRGMLTRLDNVCGMRISLSDENSITLDVGELLNNVGVSGVSEIDMWVDDVAPSPEHVTGEAEEQYDDVNLPLMCSNNVVGVIECTADVADMVGGEVPGPNVRPELLDRGFVLGDALIASSVAS